MSSPTRFLLFLVTGWVGVRAVSLGLVPGSEAFAAESAAPVVPALAETDLTPPPAMWAAPAMPPAMPAPTSQPQPWPFPVPVYQPMPVRTVRYAEARSEPAWSLPPSRYPAAASLAEPLAAASWPEIGASVARVSTPAMAKAPAGPPRFDHVQLSTWAMMRDRPGPQSLAGTGTLGGSQAGMRFLYRFNPRLAASLRATAPIGTARRGGDVALGVRYAPFAHLPVAVTLERRQGFGDMGGPSGFALLGEGGLYRRFGSFRLDSYLQAGMIVGKDGRMGFVDGSAVVTRHLWRNLDVGAGVWGAKQPGLSRLDVGPRLSLDVGHGIRAHADYRVKAAGNAQPGSGGVITLAGEF